jgi:AcrR family transcriptional regulator
MLNQNDPRVKRTRQLIQEAFWTLMLAKGFDSVTVRDIAREATVNRSTFYAHYADKYAVLDDLTAIAFDRRVPAHIRFARAFTDEVCRAFVGLTYDYIVSFYRQCGFDNKSFGARVDGQIKRILSQYIENILIHEATGCDVDTRAAMISSAIYGATYHWYIGKKGDDIEPLSDLVVSFVAEGIGGLKSPVRQ